MTVAVLGSVALLLAAAAAEVERLVPETGQAALVPLVGAALLLAGALGRPPTRPRLVRWGLAATGAVWLLPSLVTGTERWHQALLVMALGAVSARSVPGWLALVGAATVPLAGVGGVATAAAIFLGLAAVATAARQPLAALAAGLVGAVLGASWTWSRIDPSGWDPVRALIAYELALVLVALLHGVGTRVASARRLEDRLAVDSSGGLVGLQQLLRVYLRSPQLEIAGVGAAGLPVTDDKRPLAVVAGRSPALDDPVTREAVVSVVRLVALAEERRQVLDRHTTELEHARARLVVAIDDERSATANLLHERVVGPIEDTIARLETYSELEGIRLARDQLARSVTEIRETAFGMLPRALGAGGLGRALLDLTSRSPVPCSLAMQRDVDAGEAAEVALFYACSEALANAAKHSRARRIEVAMQCEHGLVTLTVTDDGTGGADPAGLGLRGIADRLAGAGGGLRVDSPPGAGTKLVATVPVSPSPRAPTA